MRTALASPRGNVTVKNSGCTQFCGEVMGDLRYECFSICDRMLDRCLATGEWSDLLTVDPGTGKPPYKKDLVSSTLLRMMMLLGDTDGDGTLSPKEISSLKSKLFRGSEPSGEPNTPATTDTPAAPNTR